mgnify:CR=1 FL=1
MMIQVIVNVLPAIYIYVASQPLTLNLTNPSSGWEYFRDTYECDKYLTHAELSFLNEHRSQIHKDLHV